MSPLLPAAEVDPSDDGGDDRLFQVVAARDMPFYGSFEVLAANPEAALAKAKAALMADAGVLNEAEPDGVHSLRIVSLQADDQDPLFTDVSLDPEAPLWPGPAFRNAVLSTTASLAHLIASLGEAEAYPTALDQLVANLRLLHLDCEGAAVLAAACKVERPEAWVEQVMQWAWAQTAVGVGRREEGTGAGERSGTGFEAPCGASS